MTDAEVAGEYEEETARVILERFRDLDPAAVPAVLVRSHGPFTWGPDAHAAIETAQALEIVAQMASTTLALAPDVEGISRALLDRHFLRKHGADAYYGQD